ncbi:MAG: TatD family hydrolase [Candidatus Diapherotrites archaeon]
MLIDSHCHLDWFEDKKQVVEDAKHHGVTNMVSCATSLKSIKEHLLLPEMFPEVKICLGLHPSDILRMSAADIEEGKEIVRKNLDKAVAIGEIGLDYKHAVSDEQKKLQKNIFLDFIEMSRAEKKPLVVHSRFCGKEVLQTLTQHANTPVLMHWFTNSIEEVKEAVDLGYFISVGPAVIQSIAVQEIVKEIPLSNLMLESDAPVSFQGKESTSRWIEWVAEKIAEIKGIPFKNVAETTTENAKKFFNF